MKRSSWGDLGVRVGLAVFVLWTLLPILWLVVSSLLRTKALTSKPPDLSIPSWTLGNYREVLASGQSLGPALLTSTVVSLGTP